MTAPSGSLNTVIEPSCATAMEQMPGCQNRATTLWRRWLKFNFVGGLGIVIQFGALFLLKSVLHFHYLLATAIAVEAAVMHNFVWHEQFTWADRIERERHTRAISRWRASLPRLWRFHLGNGLVSIVGNLALMKAMVGQGHVNYLLANAIAIALCSIANFLVSEEWVFSEGR
jgi:putative flippase GtrA